MKVAPPALLKTYINTPPRILFDKQTRLALIWSAKAGSTFAVKWFFYQIGLLNAALYYGRWVHRFREEVFYRSSKYLNTIKHFSRNHADYNVIKIVRNPFDRAVSNYLHALEWMHKRKPIIRPFRLYLRSRHLLRRIDEFSFYEFVGFLETIDLNTCDIHFKKQYHPIEKNKLLNHVHIIKLEDSYNALKRIERDLHLKETNLDDFRSSRHHTERKPVDACFARELLRYDPNKNYPASRSFYDEQLKQKITSLYREDFEAYEYNTDT